MNWHRTLTSAICGFCAVAFTINAAAQTTATRRAAAALTSVTARIAAHQTTTSAQTLPGHRGAAHQTTPTVRWTYDMVAPDQDATSRTLADASALTSDTERLHWLQTAATDVNFKEVTDPSYQTYKSLVPGNETEEPEKPKRYVATADAYGSDISRQPAGPLTGKIVYCSAGHGWTNDNTSTTMWYTQRPETHGVVEDMGNLDQMNLYADICFRAGATIVPMRPLGFQHIERVIDNDSGQAAFYGQWADSKSTASFGFAGAEIPYRFARAATKESSVARFRPVIPVTDLYPVYCWARAGADRVTQTYRVVYAGGVNEVDVDHRRVGNGWVYLGSYVFKAGTTGYVEVTNEVRDAESVSAGGVVIADAIRFGNGMGDVNRGGGISRYPREEECSRYWVERSIAAGYPPIYDAFVNGEDQSNNVGAAPRFAAHMNRETAGAFFDRVFVSFHSNASGGRGVVGLFNAHAIMRPEHQIELAKLAADELNAEMTRAGVALNKPWFVRPIRTDAHINFGEIRRDYLNNEMSATIVEVAFHDNADDAALLRRLSVRSALAQSAYRATVRYFSEIGRQKLEFNSPPAAPTLLSVVQGETSGTVDLTWKAAAEDPLSSPAKDMHYRVYRSQDGVVFDRGKDVGAVTKYTFDKIKEHDPGYFYITAISSGGESLPSTVLGVSRTAGPRVLVVQGAATVEDDTAVTRTEPANLGSATRPGGSYVRLIPNMMNNREQVRAVGDGVNRLNLGFDSMDMSVYLSNPDAQKSYSTVCFILGRSPVAEDLASSRVLTSLHDYVTSGGRLFIDGACLAECDGSTTDGLERWGEFSNTVLQTGYDPLTTVSHVIKSGDRELTTVTLEIGDRRLHYFDARPNEVLKPADNGRAVLAYENLRGVAAVATLKDRHIRTVVIGFPLEELEKREEQGVLVAQILMAMGMEIQPLSKRIAETDEPRVNVEDVVVAKAEVADQGTTASK